MQAQWFRQVTGAASSVHKYEETVITLLTTYCTSLPSSFADYKSCFSLTDLPNECLWNRLPILHYRSLYLYVVDCHYSQLVCHTKLEAWRLEKSFTLQIGKRHFFSKIHLNAQYYHI